MHVVCAAAGCAWGCALFVLPRGVRRRTERTWAPARRAYGLPLPAFCPARMPSGLLLSAYCPALAPAVRRCGPDGGALSLR